MVWGDVMWCVVVWLHSWVSRKVGDSVSSGMQASANKQVGEYETECRCEVKSRMRALAKHDSLHAALGTNAAQKHLKQSNR